jgi:hypothetical protein
MDEIERQVRLPEGASPLKDYARHYALEQDGKIIGVYVLRTSASGQAAAKQATDYGCEEIAIEGAHLVGKSVPCPPTSEPQNEVGGGERRWFNNRAELPVIMDGGCGFVTVRFDTSKHRVDQAFCNGEA